jgi:hypothetical protein
MEYFLTESIIARSLSFIVIIVSSNKDSYLVSLIWNSSTFACQTNTQHQIVDLKIPFQDVEQKVILDNIRCTEHLTNMTCLFCRTCDHLVCPDCVSFEYFLTESIIARSLSFIVIIVSSNKDSYLVSLIWNSSTFA